MKIGNLISGLFLLVVLSSCLPRADRSAQIAQYNENERNLVVKIMEEPMWNYSKNLINEFLPLIIKNSNAKIISVFAKPDFLIASIENDKFSNEILNKKYSLKNLVKVKVIHNDEEIGEIHFQY